MRYYLNQKEVESKLKKVRDGTLKRKKARKKHDAQESVHYDHVIKQFVEGHEFIVSDYLIVKYGYFKCPLCGIRSKKFVKIIRDDRQSFHIGMSCLNKVGHHKNTSGVEWREVVCPPGSCINETELQRMMRETAKAQDLIVSAVVMKDRRKVISDQDMRDLLEDL